MWKVHVVKRRLWVLPAPLVVPYLTLVPRHCHHSLRILVRHQGRRDQERTGDRPQFRFASDDALWPTDDVRQWGKLRRELRDDESHACRVADNAAKFRSVCCAAAGYYGPIASHSDLEEKAPKGGFFHMIKYFISAPFCACTA